MGRRTIVVDRVQLEDALKYAEGNGPLKNLDALWKRAAEIYNLSDKKPEEITFSTVALRVKEWGIEVKTQPGKKGLAKGEKLSAERKAAMKAGRGKKKVGNHPMKEKVRAAMEARLKENDQLALLPLIDRVIDGSPSACRKWDCLECVGYDRKEVRDCTDLCCGNWLKRPYQKFVEGAPEEPEEPDVNSEAA